MDNINTTGTRVNFNFLTEDEKKEAIEELDRLIENDPREKVEFLMAWCKQHGLNYKTFNNWKDPKEAKPVQKKQRMRIKYKLFT